MECFFSKGCEFIGLGSGELDRSSGTDCGKIALALGAIGCVNWLVGEPVTKIKISRKFCANSIFSLGIL